MKRSPRQFPCIPEHAQPSTVLVPLGSGLFSRFGDLFGQRLGPSQGLLHNAAKFGKNRRLRVRLIMFPVSHAPDGHQTALIKAFQLPLYRAGTAPGQSDQFGGKKTPRRLPNNNPSTRCCVLENSAADKLTCRTTAEVLALMPMAGILLPNMGMSTLPHPLPCVLEHTQPGAVLLPCVRMPGVLHGAEHALGVRHHDAEASIRRGEPGDALR